MNITMEKNKKPLNIDEKFIKKATEKALKIDDIARNTRKNDYIEARCVYYRVCRQMLGISLEKIGLAVKRNHATVLHGLKQFENIRECRRKYEIVMLFTENSLVMEHEAPMVESIFKMKLDALIINYTEKIQDIKLEHQAQLQRLNDPFLSQLTELSPQQYSEFKERAEVILKMLKNKVTYQTISRDNFNCKKESLKIDLI